MYTMILIRLSLRNGRASQMQAVAHRYLLLPPPPLAHAVGARRLSPQASTTCLALLFPLSQHKSSPAASHHQRNAGSRCFSTLGPADTDPRVS